VKKTNVIWTVDELHPNEVRLLLDSLKVAVELAIPTLGPHGPLKLADSLSLLRQALGEGFENCLQSIKKSPTQDIEIGGMIGGFVGYLRILHDNYLGNLHFTDSHSFPVELLHPMKQMLIEFGGYTKDKTSFGLLHWDQYNFRVTGFPNPLISITKQLKHDMQIDCSDSIKKEMAKLPEYFIFFTYPQAEGRNVFLHGLLFHELGHAIDWKKKISKSLIKDIKWLGKDLNSKIPNIFEDWVKEITADLLAIRLWGPCVLFSSRLTSLTVGVMDADCDSHPATRFRLWWMLEHLKRMGYMEDKLRVKTAEILRDWHNNLKPMSGGLPHYVTVRSVLEDTDVVEALHSIVEKGIVGHQFNAENFIQHVPSVVDNFKLQLPHCGKGIGPATHMASVFNAVWETNLQKQSLRESEEKLVAEREILCNLALKSIEGNYIQSLWGKK
jgi:hypothetical protein